MLRLLYSPECVEGEFSEVELRLYGVLGSWHSSGPSSSTLRPYASPSLPNTR
jgi:hypothetical protein